MSGSAPAEGPPAGATVSVTFPMHWSDMDAFEHVNNAVYFRWFESARLAYFLAIGWPDHRRATGIGPILHSTEARFRVPLQFPDEIRASTWVSEIGEDRFTMQYEVRSLGLDRVAADGSGRIVAFDYRSGTKAVLPDVIRARILERGLGPAAGTRNRSAGR
ncbi:MAG: thioesterase family protein [Thermoanaerobaculia bacterium]